MPTTVPASWTKELGTSRVMGRNGGDITPWEENYELVWPESVRIYDKMRKTDGQCSSVIRAANLLTRGTSWNLMGSDVNPRIKDFVEMNLGIRADQDGIVRASKYGVRFMDWLRMAQVSGPIGHSFFERIYTVEKTTDLETGLPVTAYLDRLSWRPHRSIQEFVVARDGSLEAIKQWVPVEQYQWDVKPIPGDQLVAVVNEQEGADYAGTSWFRACWFNWSTKTKMAILDAIGIERQSAGVPVFEHDPSISSEAALAKARKIRTGEDSAIAYPMGQGDFKIVGVTGGTRDPLPSIKYHDEMIGRTLLAMLLNLGHDSGAYSLGQTYFDVFCKFLTSWAQDLALVATEQIIRPLVAANFGVDEPYPVLVPEDITPDTTLSPEELKMLVDAGVITPDMELEENRRDVYGFPPLEIGDGERIDPTPIEDVQEATPELMAASKATDLDQMRERAKELYERIDARKKAQENWA